MSRPNQQPTSHVDRVLAELREGPATFRELRALLPDLNAQQINGALNFLTRTNRVTASDEKVRINDRRGGRIYELPGWEGRQTA